MEGTFFYGLTLRMWNILGVCLGPEEELDRVHRRRVTLELRNVFRRVVQGSLSRPS